MVVLGKGLPILRRLIEPRVSPGFSPARTVTCLPPRATHMIVHLLKSKIHRARVTAASLHYEGSLTIAEDLMQSTGLLPYERILCGNLANGKRWETYAIPGRKGSGAIELNGAVARLGKKGDLLTIMSFTEMPVAAGRRWKPQVIVLGPENRVVDRRGT